MGKAIAQTVMVAGVFGLLLFLPAGTLAWPQAWAFLAIFTVTSLATAAALARHDPALLKERTSLSGGRTLRGWDRLFFALLVAGILGWFAGMGWEARLRPPAWGWPLQALGGAMIAACMWTAWLTFRVNSFATPAVQVQRERGQEVIQTGPYAVVRHPLYAGALLWMIGTPLLLGSQVGFLGSAAMAILVAVRAVGEEQVLSRELPGYADYRRKVRFRMVPGVW